MPTGFCAFETKAYTWISKEQAKSLNLLNIPVFVINDTFGNDDDYKSRDPAPYHGA